jgi:hypothetical protein
MIFYYYFTQKHKFIVAVNEHLCNILFYRGENFLCIIINEEWGTFYLIKIKIPSSALLILIPLFFHMYIL